MGLPIDLQDIPHGYGNSFTQTTGTIRQKHRYLPGLIAILHLVNISDSFDASSDGDKRSSIRRQGNFRMLGSLEIYRIVLKTEPARRVFQFAFPGIPRSLLIRFARLRLNLCRDR